MTENEDVTIKALKREVAEQMTEYCTKIAYLIAGTSNDERHLLDGIKLANEGVRSMATTIFVETQKARNNENQET